MNTGKNMKELGLSYFDGGGVNQSIHVAEHIISYESSLPLLVWVSKRNMYVCSPEDMHQSIHRNTIPNSPKMEMT